MTREGVREELVPASPGLIIFLISGVAATTLLIALRVASRLAQTSDSVQSFVAAHAIVRGNVLLSGWNVPLDDYYFTDTIPYAALEWLLGPRPFLLVLVPALTYALFICVGLVLCLRPTQPFVWNVEAGAAVTLLLGAPAWIGTWNPLLLSDMHFASVLGALLALALCAGVARSEWRNGWALGALCFALVVVAGCTAASDPFSLVFAFGPALALLSADLLMRPDARNERLALLILACGTAIGILLPPLIALAGGFTTENIVVADLVAWRHLGRNLIALMAGVLALFGVNPFGKEISLSDLLLLVVHFAALTLASLAVLRVARRLFGKLRVPLLDRMLCVGALTVLAACALSTQFGKGITPQTLWAGGPPMRYVMPAVLFSGVLGARQTREILAAIRGDHMRKIARGALVLFAALALLAGSLSSMKWQPRPIGNSAPAVAAGWLEQQRLTEGEGEYWSANLVTAMSGNAVHVRSVVSLVGRLVPYVLAADRNWYRSPPQFVIWRDRNPTGVTFEDVRATHVVCRMAYVAGYHIAIVAAGDRGHPCLCTNQSQKRPD